MNPLLIEIGRALHEDREREIRDRLRLAPYRSRRVRRRRHSVRSQTNLRFRPAT